MIRFKDKYIKLFYWHILLKVYHQIELKNLLLEVSFY